MRNRLIKTAPPAYKNVIITLLINETGNPLDEIIEKIWQLGNLGEWNPQGSAGNQKKSYQLGFSHHAVATCQN